MDNSLKMNINSMKKYINPYNLFVGSFIPNWLLRRKKISPGTKLCYARLAQFAGKDGDCFPSQTTLATEIGTCTRQIRRYINELEEQELIDSVQIGLNQPNRYRFLWHPWMEEKEELKKEPSEKKGKRRKQSDRTYKSTPDRTSPSSQERLHTSDKENHLRESIKKTTTGDVVVDSEEIEKVKKALAPSYLEMPDIVIADLIMKKGVEHVFSTADQIAYQLRHGSNPPDNPIGHFIDLTLKGMNRPHGYKSPEEIAQHEKAKMMKAANRRKKSMQAWKERIPREQLKDFIVQLSENNDKAIKPYGHTEQKGGRKHAGS